MGIKITIYARTVQALDKAILQSADLTMEALKTDVISAQVMPFDTGAMQNADTFVDTRQDGDTVISTLVTGSPQARRLYYHPEYNFQTVNNPNAGGEWLEPWIDGDKKGVLEEAFTKLLKKEVGL